MNEISHFQAKIEVALQLASEYVQNYDQKVQVRCQSNTRAVFSPFG